MAVCASSPVPTPARFVFHQPSVLFTHASTTVPASYPQPPQPVHTTVGSPRTNSQVVLAPGADRLVQHVSATQSGVSMSPQPVSRVPRSPISSRTRSRLSSSEPHDGGARGPVNGSLVQPQTISWGDDLNVSGTVRPYSVATIHHPVSSITSHSLLQPTNLPAATGHHQISALSLPRPPIAQPPLQSSSSQSPTERHYIGQQRVPLPRHHPSSGPDASMSHQEGVISAAAPATMYYVDPDTGRTVLTRAAPAVQSAPSQSVRRRQPWTGQLVGGPNAPGNGAVMDTGVPVERSSPIDSGTVRMALGSSNAAMVGRSSPTTGAVVEHGSSLSAPLNAHQSASAFPPGKYILTGVSGIRGISPSYIGVQHPGIPAPVSIEVQQPHNRVTSHLSHLPPPPPYSYHLAPRFELGPSLQSSSFESMRSDGGNVRPHSPVYFPEEVRRVIRPQDVAMAVSHLRQMETRNSVSSSSTLQERDYISPQPNSLSVSPQATAQAVSTTAQAVIPFTIVPMSSTVANPRPPTAVPTQSPSKQKPANDEPIQGSASSPIIIEDSEEPPLSTTVKKPPPVASLQQSARHRSQVHHKDGENELQEQVGKEPTQITIDDNGSADMELENRINNDSPGKSTKIVGRAVDKSQEEQAAHDSPLILECNELTVKEQSQGEKMTHDSRVMVESFELSVREHGQEGKITHESPVIVESAEPPVNEPKEQTQEKKVSRESPVIVESAESTLSKQRKENITTPIASADNEVGTFPFLPNTPPLSPNTSSNVGEIAVLASDGPATSVLPESEAAKLAAPQDPTTSSQEKSVSSKEKTLHFGVTHTEPEKETEANRLDDVDMGGEQEEDEVQGNKEIEKDIVKGAEKWDKEPHFSVESKMQTATEPLKGTNELFDQIPQGKNAADLQITTKKKAVVDDTSDTASSNDMSNKLDHTGTTSAAMRSTLDRELSGTEQQPPAEDQTITCQPSLTGQHGAPDDHCAPEVVGENVEQVGTVNTSPAPLLQQKSALPTTPVQEAHNDSSSSARITTPVQGAHNDSSSSPRITTPVQGAHNDSSSSPRITTPVQGAHNDSSSSPRITTPVQGAHNDSSSSPRITTPVQGAHNDSSSSPRITTPVQGAHNDSSSSPRITTPVQGAHNDSSSSPRITTPVQGAHNDSSSSPRITTPVQGAHNDSSSSPRITTPVQGAHNDSSSSPRITTPVQGAHNDSSSSPRITTPVQGAHNDSSSSPRITTPVQGAHNDSSSSPRITTPVQGAHNDSSSSPRITTPVQGAHNDSPSSPRITTPVQGAHNDSSSSPRITTPVQGAHNDSSSSPRITTPVQGAHNDSSSSPRITTPVQEAHNDNSPKVTPGILKHTSQFDTPISSTSRRRRVQFANNPVFFNSPKEDSDDVLKTPKHCMSCMCVLYCDVYILCHSHL